MTNVPPRADVCQCCGRPPVGSVSAPECPTTGRGLMREDADNGRLFPVGPVPPVCGPHGDPLVSRGVV